jgi:hypothetical protein
MTAKRDLGRLALASIALGLALSGTPAVAAAAGSPAQRLVATYAPVLAFRPDPTRRNALTEAEGLPVGSRRAGKLSGPPCNENARPKASG